MAIPQELLQQAIALVQSGEKSLSDLKPEFRREVENAMPASYAPGSAPILRSEPTVTRNLGQSMEPQNTGPNNFIRSAGYTASLPIEGLGQRLNETLGLLGIDQNTTGLPTPESVRARREAAEEFQSTGGGITGSLLSSAPLMAARRFPPVMAGGAIFGGLMPTTENESVLMNMATGAGLATVGQVAGDLMQGIGTRIIRGPQSQARELSEQGVELTPGMLEGGTANVMEQQATSTPILGTAIMDARERAITDFNRVAINRALQPLGQEVVEAGTQGIDDASRIISDSYDAALKNIDNIEVDSAWNKTTQGIRNKLAESGDLQQLEVYDEVINEVLGKGVDLTSEINARTWNQIKKKVANRSFTLGKEPENFAATEALDDVVDAMMDMMERSGSNAPEAVALLKNANAAFRLFEPVRRAAGRASSAQRGGVFTPEVLMSNVVARKPAQAARGNLPMQDFALQGQNVIGRAAGASDSGTGGRLGLLSLSALAANSPLRALGMGAGLLGSRYAYAPGTIDLVNRAARARPDALRDFSFQMSPGLKGALGITAGSELGLLGR